MQSTKSILLSGFAAFSLMACGGNDEGMASSPNGMASSLTSGSPIDQPYKLKDGDPLDVNTLLSAIDMAGAIAYGSSPFDEALGATAFDQNPRF